MNKTDYMAAIAKNVHDMHQLMLKYKYSYDHYERSQLFDIARKINRYNPVLVPEANNLINEGKLYRNFLFSIEEFDSDIIYNFYEKLLREITLKRSKSVEGDDAELEYDITKGRPTKFYVNLPKNKLTITNQIGFAHEMGHVPEIDKPRNSFLEYSEALPMFFEYIASLDCYGLNYGKDNFLCERLSMELVEASNILKLFKKCDSRNETESLYYKQLFADNYKFLESLDYALQLIDLYEQDKKIIVPEIEKIIEGKSLIDVSKDLEIDTTDCKRLIREYKK